MAADTISIFSSSMSEKHKADESFPTSSLKSINFNHQSVEDDIEGNYCQKKESDDDFEANDEMKVKKTNLPISANQWCGRVRQMCAMKRLGIVSWLPIILCLYSILKEIKVGEPFLFEYQSKFLNLTEDQITGEIYPYTPYTYTVSLIPIFLLTDLLLYKPTMLAEMIGQIIFRSTLVFGGSVLSQIVGQIFYGIASASEIAFFSYIYARLEKNQYQKLTSWTRAGTMAGRTFGYLFSQFLIYTQFGDLFELNVIAFILPCVVLIFCVFLPRVHWKIMVGRMLEAKGLEIKASSSATTSQLPKTYFQYVIYRVRKIRSDFCKIYSIGFIRKWSLWWAMTTCMSLQIALFSQTLWGNAKIQNKSLNGLAEATYTATAALAILAMNAFPLDWDKYGELALVIISSIDAGVLLVYSQTDSIYIMYGCYICYRSLYQVMITIAQWNIAKKMVCESYGLVFGTNSFVALIMQSLLMFIISDENGLLGLHIRDQYVVYAGCHFVIAQIFLLSVIYNVISYLCIGCKVDPKKAKTSTTQSVDFEESNSNSHNDYHNTCTTEIGGSTEFGDNYKSKQQKRPDGFIAEWMKQSIDSNGTPIINEKKLEATNVDGNNDEMDNNTHQLTVNMIESEVLPQNDLLLENKSTSIKNEEQTTLEEVKEISHHCK